MISHKPKRDIQMTRTSSDFKRRFSILTNDSNVDRKAGARSAN
jgi:hypothetical protein